MSQISRQDMSPNTKSTMLSPNKDNIVTPATNKRRDGSSTNYFNNKQIQSPASTLNKPMGKEQVSNSKFLAKQAANEKVRTTFAERI
jgi:hypothetical protein